MTDTEFDDHITEQQAAPACGSCLILAEHLHAHMATIYVSADKRVYPPRPRDAWRELASTRWSRHIDVQGFVDQPDLSDAVEYERIAKAFNPEQLTHWTNEMNTKSDEQWDDVRRRRDQARAVPPASSSENEA